MVIIMGKIILFVSLLFVFFKRGDICASIGKLFYARGKTERSLKWFELGKKMGGMSFDHQLLYAYLTLKEGDIENASKMFVLLLMEKPKPEQKIRLKSSYALVLWKRKEVNEAIEMLEEVVQKAPSTAVYGSLGYMYAYNRDLEKALEFNLEAYDYNNTNPIIVDNLAFTYLQMGDDEKAKEYYEKLFELDPKFPEGYFEYGKLLIKMGDKKTGEEYIKKALEKEFSFLSMITRQDIILYLEQLGEENE